ncbi:MAG: hypothetical protein K9G76_03020 [Bacteroidales bacterium]|nr:hypothetical protein [Bacteroidales bacterium]MCF8402766.1 hypothetical protein [Bacteroidales bacterium]
MNKNNTHKDKNTEKEDIFPLAGIQKNMNPFEVPVNYFETLPGKIQARINKEDQGNASDSRVIKFKSRYIYASLAAAMVALLVTFGIYFFQEDTQDTFPEITLNDVLNDYPELIEYMDESLLIETILASSTGELDYSIIDFSNDSSITDEEIFDYLNDEDYSEEILYNL